MKQAPAIYKNLDLRGRRATRVVLAALDRYRGGFARKCGTAVSCAHGRGVPRVPGDEAELEPQPGRRARFTLPRRLSRVGRPALTGRSSAWLGPRSFARQTPRRFTVDQVDASSERVGGASLSACSDPATAADGPEREYQRLTGRDRRGLDHHLELPARMGRRSIDCRNLSSACTRCPAVPAPCSATGALRRTGVAVSGSPGESSPGGSSVACTRAVQPVSRLTRRARTPGAPGGCWPGPRPVVRGRSTRPNHLG